jgi:hypothetical protein
MCRESITSCQIYEFTSSDGSQTGTIIIVHMTNFNMRETLMEKFSESAPVDEHLH